MNRIMTRIIGKVLTKRIKRKGIRNMMRRILKIG